MTVADCSVCSCEQAEYKCPVCRMPYCSIKCCQTHKDSCTAPETKEHEEPQDTKEKRVRWDESSNHFVTKEALGWLGESRRLRRLLANKHLRELIRLADTTDQPDRTMRELMVEPLFVEFADECLRIVEGGAEPCSDDSD